MNRISGTYRAAKIAAGVAAVALPAGHAAAQSNNNVVGGQNIHVHFDNSDEAWPLPSVALDSFVGMIPAKIFSRVQAARLSSALKEQLDLRESIWVGFW